MLEAVGDGGLIGARERVTECESRLSGEGRCGERQDDGGAPDEPQPFAPPHAFDPVPAASPGLEPLFLVQSSGRFLYASQSPFSGAAGSYEVDGLPQSQEPTICLSDPLIAAAAPVDDGFVAAFTDALMPGTSCALGAPPPGTSIALFHYVPGTGPALVSTFVAVVEPGENDPAMAAVERHRQLAVKAAAGKRQEGALITANAIELALDQCIAQQIATCQDKQQNR